MCSHLIVLYTPSRSRVLTILEGAYFLPNSLCSTVRKYTLLGIYFKVFKVAGNEVLGYTVMEWHTSYFWSITGAHALMIGHCFFIIAGFIVEILSSIYLFIKALQHKFWRSVGHQVLQPAWDIEFRKVYLKSCRQEKNSIMMMTHHLTNC